MVWGGGVSFTGGQFALGESINTTAPNGSTMWRARYNNTTGRTIPIVIHAVCANQPGSYSMQFATADNPPHTQSNAIAICPSNAVLLSGGAFSTSDKASVFMLSDFPVTQRKFRVVMWNGSDQDERVTAFAICGHRPAGYTITQQSFTTMVNGNTLLASGAQCPAPTRVIGGGVKVTAPNTNVVPASSLDEPNTQWISDTLVANAATVTQTNYAICAGHYTASLVLERGDLAESFERSCEAGRADGDIESPAERVNRAVASKRSVQVVSRRRHARAASPCRSSPDRSRRFRRCRRWH